MAQTNKTLRILGVVQTIVLAFVILTGFGAVWLMGDMGSSLFKSVALLATLCLLVYVALAAWVTRLRRAALAAAFAVWRADPAQGATISGMQLAERSGLGVPYAMIAHQWLLAQGAREGVSPTVDPEASTVRWGFGFRKSVDRE